MDYRIIIMGSIALVGIVLFILIFRAAKELSNEKGTKIKHPWQK